MEEICNRCVHKVICEMGASPRDVSVITGCYNFREERPQTNADRIRAMTDEEIENWYWWMHKEMMQYIDSRVFLHDWLKQEVEE